MRLGRSSWAGLPFALLVVSATVLASGTKDWEFIDVDDGIHTWKKQLDGDMPAFRGQTYIEGTLHDVLTALLDWKRHTEWMYLCKESTLLEQLTPTRILMYNRVEGVGPIWDRDVIADTVLEWANDTKSLNIRFTNVESTLKPVPKGTVRMPKLEGVFKLRQVEPKKVKVLYQVEADIGGRIPKWLAELGAKDLPYHTLRRLRERVERKP